MGKNSSKYISRCIRQDIPLLFQNKNFPLPSIQKHISPANNHLSSVTEKNFNSTVKVTKNFNLEQAMKTQRASRASAPLFL